MASRLIWLAENFIRNLNRFSIGKQNVMPLSSGFINLNNTKVLSRLSTPSRAASDLFWYSLPWPKLKDALGGKINVLDLGCGSGLYGDEIDAATSGELDSYHGIDINQHDKWSYYSSANPKLSYSVAGADDIRKVYNGQGLIISQSVLEHIPNDQKLIGDVCSIALSENKRVLQIHLIPSSACFYKYLWHGYRQYTPANINRLVKNITNSKSYLIPLGGRSCNKTHISWITIPEVQSRIFKRKGKDWTADNNYLKDRNSAIQFDHDNPSHINQASFYVLIIDHNCDSDQLFSA